MSDLTGLSPGNIVTLALAIFSVIGSTITLVVTRGERAARIASDEAQAKLARAGAADNIGSAASATVDTMLQVQEQLKERLYETEGRMATLQETAEDLILRSQACVEENIVLQKRAEFLREENEREVKELVFRIKVLTTENRVLQDRIGDLEIKLENLAKRLGLTDENGTV